MIILQQSHSCVGRLGRILSAAACTLFIAAPLGCTGMDASQRDRKIASAPDPVAEARATLEFYAGGNPIGSESEMLEDLVSRVTAADAARGAKLAAFVADIRKSSSGLAGKAKKALEGF